MTTELRSQTWNVDPVHSSINFSVRHMVVSKVRGRFTKYEATIDLDEADFARSTVAVSIDAASIETGIADRDNHLRAPDFFDAGRFPSLVFRSRRVEPVGGDRYRVVGDLTIRDVTREVALEVELGGRAKDPWGNERVGFAARASFDRKDFGLRWNQVLEAGGVLVGDRVDVEIELEAVKSAVAQKAA